MGLYKPAWLNEDEEKSLQLVKRLDDEDTLFRIAKEAKHFIVKEAAVKKLIHLGHLIDIAMNDKNEYFRKTAIELLQTKFQNYNGAASAVETLTNQKILADIAKNDEDAFIRKFAEEKIGKLDCQGDGVHNWQYKGRLEERNNEDFSFCYDVYYCTKCGKEIKKDKNSF